MFSHGEDETTIPDLFRCPISLDLLRDPVSLSTGQTYDRSSIEKWISSGNLTCPVTMQTLNDPPTLVPNHTLRALIHRWLQTPNPNHHDQPLHALKRCLESQETTRLQCVESLRVLTEDSDSAAAMVRLGFLPLLLDLIFFEARDRKFETEFIEQALACVVKLLPFSESDESIFARFLDEEDSLILSLFKRGSLGIKASLCRIIAIVSKSYNKSDNKEHYPMKLLREISLLVGLTSGEASDAAVEALWWISCGTSNQKRIVEELLGVVDALISHLSRASSSLALALLERLLIGHESARDSVIKNPSGIRVLVKRVFEVPGGHEGSEGAVGSLVAVCGGSWRAREEAVEAGVLSQLVLLLQSQCSAKIKTKARMLLKLLRSNNYG